MKVWMLSGLWLAVAASGAAGAEMAIIGPTKPVRPGEPVWLEIAGAPDGAAASCFPSDVLTAGPPHVKPRQGLFHAEEAGAYLVHAFVTMAEWTGGRSRPRRYH